jgi:hypothetical protein
MPKSGKGCGRGQDIVIPTREKSGPKTGISSKKDTGIGFLHSQMEREFSLLRLPTHPSCDMSKSGRTHTPLIPYGQSTSRSENPEVVLRRSYCSD